MTNRKFALLVFHLDLQFYFNNPLKSSAQALVIKKTTFYGHKETGITNESRGKTWMVPSVDLVYYGAFQCSVYWLTE